MLILGIDTSGRHGSLALARGDAAVFELIDTVPLTGGAYSAQLIPKLAAMLAGRGLNKTSLDGFAVCSGPGSFTGLRVGLSAVKGLAEVLQRPIAAISMLEAVATAASREGKVIAALDAGRKEIFAGEYLVSDGSVKALREILLPQSEFAGFVEAAERAEVISPDQAVLDLARCLEAKQIDWPGSEAVAHLGLGKILRGETVTPEALEANYIRRSDAEILTRRKG